MRLINLSKKLASTVGAVALSASLVACAAVPTDPDERAIYDEINDPLEPMNRAIFDFNIALDDAIFEPVARNYKENAPVYIQDRISDLVDYLGLPIVFISQILQGDTEHAGETMGRFLINTITLGINDAATDAGIPNHDADFGQVLGKWGVDEGPYVVMPIFGSYNARHGVGSIAEVFANPVSRWEAEKGNRNWGYLHLSLIGLDWRADNLERVRQLRESSLDFYATARSAYRQNRRALVGETTSEKYTDPTNEALLLEDDFDDFDDPDDSETLSASN